MSGNSSDFKTEKDMAKALTQFRRCHVCGKVSACHERVEECLSCGKPFPRFYYFDDRATPVMAENGERPGFSQQTVNPLLGLTAYWDDTGSDAR